MKILINILQKMDIIHDNKYKVLEYIKTVGYSNVIHGDILEYPEMKNIMDRYYFMDGRKIIAFDKNFKYINEFLSYNKLFHFRDYIYSIVGNELYTLDFNLNFKNKEILVDYCSDSVVFHNEKIMYISAEDNFDNIMIVYDLINKNYDIFKLDENLYFIDEITDEEIIICRGGHKYDVFSNPYFTMPPK